MHSLDNNGRTGRFAPVKGEKFLSCINGNGSWCHREIVEGKSNVVFLHGGKN